MAVPDRASTVVSVLLTVGLLAICFAVFGLILSGIQQAAGQRTLYADLRQELALATAPLGGQIKPGTPVALLDGPQLNQLVVLEGTSSDTLRAGPGHRRDTSLPGQPGASILYGRSITYGAPFASITKLAPGDVLTVTTGQGIFNYKVDGVRRKGDLLPARLPAGGSRLTLVTAESDGVRKGWIAQSTVFVDATLQGDAQSAPAGRPAGIPDQEKAMAGDTGALVPLVFYLQGLLLVGVALAWARARWGFWQSWLVGVPVVLVVGWLCADTTFVLLPNLL